MDGYDLRLLHVLVDNTSKFWGIARRVHSRSHRLRSVVLQHRLKTISRGVQVIYKTRATPDTLGVALLRLGCLVVKVTYNYLVIAG